MRRLLVLGMLVAVWLPPPANGVATETASAPLCLGHEATIVGSLGQHLVATDGPDVIVSNGAERVHALGGDDLICVTNAKGGYARVEGGDGDDEIRVQVPVLTLLVPGRGDDHVVGAAGKDWVDTTQRLDGDEPGRDTIRTGRGDDRVIMTSTQLVAEGDVNAGAGVDTMVLDAEQPVTEGHELVLDNRRGRAQVDGVTTLHWAAFERFDVHNARSRLSRFVGSDADEQVRSLGGPFDRSDRVLMLGGAGSDRLVCWPSEDEGPSCGRMTLRGGPGADRLVGGRGPDLLVGGAGHDVGVGRAGVDVCRDVERRVSCDRYGEG